MTITEEAIRERAYTIWQREGEPDGRQEEHWQQALEELTAEAAAAGSPVEGVAGLDAPAKPRARRTTKAAAGTTAAAKPAKAAASPAKPAAKTTRSTRKKAD